MMKKKPCWKHVVTSWPSVYLMGAPRRCAKSIYSHWPNTPHWSGPVLLYGKNMGHFCKIFLILASPTASAHQYLAGMAEGRRRAQTSMENHQLRNNGSLKAFPLITAAFPASAVPHSSMNEKSAHTSAGVSSKSANSLPGPKSQRGEPLAPEIPKCRKNT